MEISGTGRVTPKSDDTALKRLTCRPTDNLQTRPTTRPAQCKTARTSDTCTSWSIQIWTQTSTAVASAPRRCAATTREGNGVGLNCATELYAEPDGYSAHNRCLPIGTIAECGDNQSLPEGFDRHRNMLGFGSRSPIEIEAMLHIVTSTSSHET